ncbi:MAG: VanZ family protein [Granulosicoccus sp.]
MPFDFSPSGLFAVRHLRFKRLWISIGILLILAVTIGSVISLPPPLTAVMLQDKVLHTLAYACLMGWFAQIYRHDLTRLVLVIGLTGLGVSIEFVQGTTGYRQFDVMDMVANTSGVLLAWALAYTRVGNVLAWTEQCFCKVLLKA